MVNNKPMYTYVLVYTIFITNPKKDPLWKHFVLCWKKQISSHLSYYLRTLLMGLSNFPTAAEGVLPALVMNSVLSVTLLKNMVRSLLQMVGAASSINSDEDPDGISPEVLVPRERRISITQFKSLCHNRAGTSTDTNGEADFDDTTSTSTSSSTCCSGSSGSTSGSACTECCVCLCGFEAEEEVSELSCKHFFHKGCLDKWFDNNIHTTCPLCRSID